MNTNCSVSQNAAYQCIENQLFYKKKPNKTEQKQKISKHIYPCMPEDAHISHFNTSEMLTSTFAQSS